MAAASARTRITSTCTSTTWTEDPARAPAGHLGIRADLRRCRRDQGADPGHPDRPLQHGRHPHELSRRGADAARRQPRYRGSGSHGHRRSSLRLRARRQPPGLELAIDLVVFGRAAGKRCAEIVEPNGRAPWNCRRGPPTRPSSASTGSATPTAATPTAELRAEMQKTMQNKCAVFPHRRGSGGGQGLIHKVWNAAADVKVTDRSLVWNTDLLETLEFDNLIGQAWSRWNRPPTARNPAAPMPARTSRTATTRTG